MQRLLRDLEDLESDENLDDFEDRVFSWVERIVKLYGARAADRLIERFAYWVTAERNDDPLLLAEIRKLRDSVGSDSGLSAIDGVQLVLYKIWGLLECRAFITKLDDNIQRWRELEVLRAEVEPPHALPPGHVDQELSAGDEQPALPVGDHVAGLSDGDAAGELPLGEG